MTEQPVMYRFESHGEDDTDRLAFMLAGLFVPGTVIALEGDLGAGKTRFSKAVAQALGVRGTVNSPTFTIIKQYKESKLPFYHMDVYRITQDEAADLGLDEYFYGDGVTLVEWAGLISDLLPENRLDIRIAYAGDSDRTVYVCPHGEPYMAWCRELKENGCLL